MIIIDHPTIINSDKSSCYSVNIAKKNNTFNLWISIDNRYKNFISELSDAALIGILLPAMSEKEDITVIGKMSKELFNNLNQIQSLLCKIIPHLSIVNITANNLTEVKKDTSKITLTGFSAGIDAFVTLQDYFLNPKSEIKISHLLFNNLIYRDNVFDNKRIRIQQIASKCNLPIIETKTNLHNLFPKKGIGFEQTHTVRNIVIAHALSQMGITFLYSSSFPKQDVEVKPWPDIAIVNPILLPLLSTSSVSAIDVGSEYTRIQKTNKVSQIDYSYDFLDICVDTKHVRTEYINCSQCYKCMRAMVTFEKIGILNHYNEIFNLELYFQNKEKYLKNLKNSTQLNDIDLIKFLNGEINVNP